MKNTTIVLLLLLWACSPKTGAEITNTSGVQSTEVDRIETNAAIANLTSLPIDERLRWGKLDNGMTYYIQANQKPEQRAELRLAVKAGSINEDDDQQGLAHFIEHMAFNGTKNFAKSELIDYLQSVGTRFGPDLNAYTSFDETVYMLQVRTDSMDLFDKGLLILEDWTQAIAFEDEEIDKERGVVISELRSGLGAQQRMRNQYLPVIFHGSKYAERLPIGKREILETAPYDALKRYYQDWYRPDLMALIVVGDIDVDQVEKDIKEKFGKIPAKENPRTRETYGFENHEETLVSICKDKEAAYTTARLTYKHHHVELKDEKDYQGAVTRSLYNQMLNNRLNELLQSPEPPFLYGYSGYSNEVGELDTYSSYVSTGEGKVLHGLESILQENLRVLQHGFTTSELERAKVERLSQLETTAKEQDKTQSGRLASAYVSHFVKKSPALSPKQRLALNQKLLPKISIDDVNNLAKKWISKENRVIVITGPDKEETPLPTEAQVLEVINKVETSEIQAYEDKVVDAPLLEAELGSGEITNTQSIEDLGITEWTLSNGVKVRLKPTDFQNDEILFTSYSPGGNSIYSDEDYLSAYLSAALINQSGIGAFDNTSLQKKLTGKQVRVYSSINEMEESVGGLSTITDLETMFQLIHLYFTAPRKDEDVFNSLLTRQKQILQNILVDPNYYFVDKVAQIKYNNHIRRRLPTGEDLEKLSLDEAYAIYQDRFKDASDFTFFFVGNFSLDEIQPFVLKYLGTLPATNRKENWKDIGLSVPKGEVIQRFNYGQAPKAQVDLTYHGDFEWDERLNRYHFYSLLEVLRNRMRESMREDKGGVYGVRVSGSISKYPEEGYSINVSFNAEPDQVDELIATAKQDIENAKSNGASIEDIQKVKATQRQSRIKGLQENRFWLSSMKSYYQYGLDLHNVQIESYDQLLESLNSDAIQKMANHCFGNDNYIEIVMLPEGED